MAVNPMRAAISDPVVIQWLSTLAVFFGASLLMAGLMAIVSSRILKLAAEHAIWVFIVGFAFLCSLASVSVTPIDSWTADSVLVLIPLLAVAIYFLPSLASSAARHPSFQAVFILNLLFGWTIVGWVVAILWTLRRPQEVPTYRITPFGAVPAREAGPTSDRPKSA